MRSRVKRFFRYKERTTFYNKMSIREETIWRYEEPK